MNFKQRVLQMIADNGKLPDLGSFVLGEAMHCAAIELEQEGAIKRIVDGNISYWVLKE